MPQAATPQVVFTITKGRKITGAPASNRPIPLVDVEQAWVVTEGKLDLFLTVWRDGEPSGARYPVRRVEAGGIVTGIRPVRNVALIACPAPGTRLARVPVDLLYRGRIGCLGSHLHLIEGWVCGLAESLGAEQTPLLSPSCISDGEEISVGETPKIISSKNRLAWIKHRRGSSSFAGGVSVNEDSGLFPLARQCWMEASPSAEIYAAYASEHELLDPDWTGLNRFCSLALDILAERFERSTSLDRERMQVKALADKMLVSRSMHRLAAPVQKVGETGEGDDSCTHPIFLACRMLGNRMGFRARPHPDLMRAVPIKDPVAAIAKASNVRVRRVTLKGEWWKSETGGLLCFQEETNAPLAIVPSKEGLEVYNPADNSFQPLTSRIAERINPSANVFYRPFPPLSLTPRDLTQFALRGTSREFSIIIGAGLAMGLLAMLIPYATGIVFDQLIPGAERPALAQMCLFLAIAALATSMLGVARGYAVLRLQGRTDALMQAAVWDRMLSLPVSFFRDYSSGDLAQRSLGIAKIREVLTGSTLNAILSGIFSIFSYVMLFYYSWRLALVATGLVAFACATAILIGLGRLAYQRESMRLEGKISSTLLQFVTGVSKFRVSATENRAFSSWARQFSALKTISTNTKRLSNRLTVFTAVYPLFCSGLFFGCYYAFPSFSEHVTTGDLVAFLAAFGQFLASVLTLSTSTVGALAVIPLFERALPILESVPEVTENKTTPGRLHGSIEMSHVTFRYKADAPPVLRDVSLRISSGEFVAFVGASGSGKSTLLRLLLGFERPESGAIYFDGQDVAGLDIQALRREIGVVLQTSKPVSGSIFDNIVGSAPLTIDDAWDAARAAGFDHDIRRMPMGMHTHIADAGGGISGGQRQRLLIARAIVNKPRILLFDEATSALDNRTQEIVTRSLDGLQATRIVIAHRLSTIINADRIYVLDKGSIIQFGTYNELMQVDGLFKTLAERQTV